MKILLLVLFSLLVTVMAHAEPVIEPRMLCMMNAGDHVAKRHLSHEQKWEALKREEKKCDDTNPAPKKRHK